MTFGLLPMKIWELSTTAMVLQGIVWYPGRNNDDFL